MSSLDSVILMIQISSAFLITEGGACNSSALQKCFQDNELPRSELLTNQTIQEACKSYEAFMNCTNSTGCLDVPMNRALIRGLQATFDGICQELKMEYLSHGNCLESNEVKRAQHLCALQEQSDTNQQYTECEAKNRYLSCVVRYVGVCCGLEAGKLYGNLLMRLFQPAMTRLHSPQCQLQSDIEVEMPMLCESTAMTTAMSTSRDIKSKCLRLCESAAMPTAMTTAMSTSMPAAMTTAMSTAASTAMTEMTHTTNGSNCLRSIGLSVIYCLMFITLLIKPPDAFKLESEILLS